MLDNDSDNMEFGIKELIENDKDIHLSKEPIIEQHQEKLDEKSVQIKNEFKYIHDIRELMKENELMKQQNYEIIQEMSRIKDELENNDLDLIKARQAFEQGKIDYIRVNFF